MPSSLYCLIRDEQATFVPDRLLHENVFLAHDILKHYERSSILPRMCLKIDLRKAFDSVSWSFLRSALEFMSISFFIIDHIMTCMETPWYSVLINGSLFGYFPG